MKKPKAKAKAKKVPRGTIKRKPAARPVKVKAKRQAKAKRGAVASGKLKFHPFANAFPLIEGDEFKQFCERGRERGFIKSRPIILHEGMILDGRNRWRMCQATGLVPVFRTFDPKTEGDPVEFVISENLDRRHLSASQRAMAAANLERLAVGRPRKGSTGVTREEAADRMNVSRRSIARAAVVRDLGSVDLQEAVTKGDVPIAVAADLASNLTPLEQAIVSAGGKDTILSAAKKIRADKSEKRRDERTKRIITDSDCTAESLLIEGRKYPLIFADPPVRYAMGDTERSVENHYPTMTLDELCAMGPAIRKLAMPDAVLFLTLPDTHLFVTGVALLEAWGFEHKSGAVWDKLKMGMGKYFRMQHEHLLVCTRGQGLPEPKPENKSRSVIQAPRGKHSEKPAALFAVIEKMYPQFFRKSGDPLAIELFARALKPGEKARPGWAVWGNQAPAVEAKAAA